MGEIGDIHRFSNLQQAACFCRSGSFGLSVGNFQAKTTRMSKHWLACLRYALVNTAWNVVRNNTTFKAYYDVKRAEGRSHYNALGTVPASLSSHLEDAHWQVNLTSNKRSVYQYR